MQHFAPAAPLVEPTRPMYDIRAGVLALEMKLRENRAQKERIAQNLARLESQLLLQVGERSEDRHILQQALLGSVAPASAEHTPTSGQPAARAASGHDSSSAGLASSFADAMSQTGGGEDFGVGAASGGPPPAGAGRSRSRVTGTRPQLGHYDAALAHRSFEDQLLAWQIQDLAQSVRVSESLPPSSAAGGQKEATGARPAPPASRVPAVSASTLGTKSPIPSPAPAPTPAPVPVQSSTAGLVAAVSSPPARPYPESHVHIHVHRDDTATAQPKPEGAATANAAAPSGAGSGTSVAAQVPERERGNSAPSRDPHAAHATPATAAAAASSMTRTRPPSPLVSTKSPAATPSQGVSPIRRRSAPSKGPTQRASQQARASSPAHALKGRAVAHAAAPRQGTGPARATVPDSMSRELRRLRYLAKGAARGDGRSVEGAERGATNGSFAPRSGQRAPHPSSGRRGQRREQSRRGREIASPPQPSRVSVLQQWDASLQSPRDVEVSVSPWGNQILSRANSHTELLGEVRRVAQSLERSNWVSEASRTS